MRGERDGMSCFFFFHAVFSTFQYEDVYFYFLLLEVAFGSCLLLLDELVRNENAFFPEVLGHLGKAVDNMSSSSHQKSMPLASRRRSREATLCECQQCATPKWKTAGLLSRKSCLPVLERRFIGVTGGFDFLQPFRFSLMFRSSPVHIEILRKQFNTSARRREDLLPTHCIFQLSLIFTSLVCQMA